MDSRELAFAGAAQQARMLADGIVTAPELVELYLDRISRLDRELRSFRVVLADSARQEAGMAQDRLNAGERLPLLGVPIAIKDDVDVAGEATTYGTSAHGPARTQDAEVVRRLREAGAVIIGKTAVPEMMVWSFTETITFGATRNPWNSDYTPGGSSGGSGIGSDGAGLRRHGFDSDSVNMVRAVRNQAAAGSSAACTARRRLERTECERPDGEVGGRCRAVPGRNGSWQWIRGRRQTAAGTATDCVEHQGASGLDCASRPGAAGRGRRGRSTAA